MNESFLSLRGRNEDRRQNGHAWDRPGIVVKAGGWLSVDQHEGCQDEEGLNEKYIWYRCRKGKRNIFA